MDKIIDAHVHQYSAKQAPKLLQSMQKNGIAHSVVLYWPAIEPPQGFSFSAAIRALSRRPFLSLVGSLRVTNNPAFLAECREIQTALEKKQIRGIKFYPGYEHFFANDYRIKPLLELCAKHRVPAIFHCGDTNSPKNQAKARFAQPIYVDDVAVENPRLKIIISHLGNPWTIDTAEVLYKNKNVYTDISGILSPKRHAGYEKLLKQKTQKLVDFAETPRRLIFGSDYPIYDQKPYIEFVERFSEFSKTDKKTIYCKNAEKLFGL